MIERRPILLTGSHRSGTTWAGKIISSSKEIGYLMEPFSVSDPRPGLVNLKFDRWFQYINQENGHSYYEQIERMLDYKYGLIAGLSSIRSSKEFLKLLRDYYLFLQYRQSGARPLVKEPTAIFLAPWFSESYNSDVIIMIRHPAAFVSSLMILQWRHPFSHFLEQPALMRDHLFPFEEQIRLYATNEQKLIDQAILLWRIIHYTIRMYKEKYRHWIYLRHEDLSRRPMSEFEGVFSQLGIEFDARVRRTIGKYSSRENPQDSTTPELKPQRDKAIKRDSKANIYNWKKRLTEKEIDHIRVQVEEISKDFYLDSDW